MTGTLGSDALNKRLARALRLAGDTHTIEDIRHAIARGTMQCFVKDNSFVITEVINAPQKKYLNVFMVVGELSVLDLHDEIEAFAAQAGCAFMQAYGRHGWTPKNKNLGWNPVQTVFRKTIG